MDLIFYKKISLILFGFYILFFTSCDNVSSTEPSTSAPVSSDIEISGDLDMKGYKILNVINVPSLSSDPTLANDGQVLQWNESLRKWDWADLTGSVAGVSSVTVGSGPLSISNSNTTPVVSITQADLTHDGFLSSADFSTFNNKLSSSTSFNGDVTGSFNNLILAPTIGLSGTATKVSYDSKGRITAASSLISTDITSALGYTPISNSLSSAKILVGNASGIASAVTLSGDATLSNLGVITFSNVITAGQYVRVTVDSKGRVTAGSTSLDLSTTSVSGVLPVTKGGTGSTTFGTNYVLLGNGTSAFNTVDPGISGYILTSTGGTWTARAPSPFSSYEEVSKSITLSGERSGIHYTFDGREDVIFDLPDITKIEDGFTLTISLETPYHLTVRAFGVDTFLDGSPSLDMLGRNLQAITIMKRRVVSENWKIINQVPLCSLGQSCWASNQIYIGQMNGYQVFTTPRGCDDDRRPNCDGRDEKVRKPWANSSPEVDNQITDLANDGKKISEILMSFATTEAAAYCENLEYAGHDDWYLPRADELRLVFDTAKTDINFISDVDYWSSQDPSRDEAYALNPYQRSVVVKTDNKFIRCIRRQ